MRIPGTPIATTSPAPRAGRSTTSTMSTTSTIRTMTSVGPGARIRPALHPHDPITLITQDLTEDTDPRIQDGGTRHRSDRTGDHTRRHTCPVT